MVKVTEIYNGVLTPLPPVEMGSEFPCRPDHVLKRVAMLKRELVDVFDVAHIALAYARAFAYIDGLFGKRRN